MREDVALALGGAATVWDEVLEVEALIGRRWDGLVIAANDVGVHWPRRLHHWVTLHPRKMERWRRERAENGHPGGYVTWARHTQYSDQRIQPWPNMSSGGLAVQVALERLRVRRVVLCGIGMNPAPYFEETTERHQVDVRGCWDRADKHWEAWEDPAMVKFLTGRVKSMRGRTRDLLGAPTAEWINGEASDG